MDRTRNDRISNASARMPPRFRCGPDREAQVLPRTSAPEEDFFPAASRMAASILEKLANECQQSAQRYARQRYRTSSGRAHDQEHRLRSLVQVNVIHAYARAAHRPATFCLIQQNSSGFRRTAHNQSSASAISHSGLSFVGQYDVPTRLLLSSARPDR